MLAPRIQRWLLDLWGEKFVHTWARVITLVFSLKTSAMSVVFILVLIYI